MAKTDWIKCPMEHGQKRRETWRRWAEQIACVNENNEGDQSETLESQPPFHIFGKSSFLKLEKDWCGGNLWQRFGVRFMAARFGAEAKARKWVSISTSSFCNLEGCVIYTGQKCLNISSFFADWMRWKRFANQPNERDIPQVKKVHACLYAYNLDVLLEIIPDY